ncbi:MAG: monofunctional biosynthetic peptidoglycan transglycosylase [Flavobacteriaceae bacterium]|nr:monofunctional biosynthetic peptidoglycan transglycosylase [Flavobacteriaceae bacterium]
MLRKLVVFLFKIAMWFIAITVLWVLVYKFVPIPYTPLMAIRSIENEAADFSTKHDWVPIEAISKNLQLAVVASEDQNFLKHGGFDYEAIEKAYQGNKAGKKIRGGSTISQQTAKNVFLWPQRSWLRKGLETYFTFLIELFWSKERIMEVYLNSIEMGKGVYGADAAAQHWFRKSAKSLSQYEAAAIAAILPNPLKYRAAPASNYIEKRKQWIVRQMRYYGTFTLEKQPGE